jgi:hypothetical protein
VAVAVDSIAFRDVFRSEKKKPAPEEFCFHRVMQETLSGCEKFKDRLNLPIAIVFEIREGLSWIAFADDRFAVPLQAADLRKGEDAWGADSPFFNLLLARDSNYGLLYEQEFWDRASVEKQRDGILQGAKFAT